MNHELVDIEIDLLDAHPANSNVMPDEAFVKLRGHLKRTGRYPPVIVRPTGGGRYQLLDGHHRVKALRELDQSRVHCLVWEADDDEALLLMATLNRLQGRDDPRKRAALLDQLASRFEAKDLASRLPESTEKLKRLLELNAGPLPIRNRRGLKTCRWRFTSSSSRTRNGVL